MPGDGEGVAGKLHQLDQYALKGVDKANALQGKIDDKKPGAKNDDKPKKGPAGGFDTTPVPRAPPGWTVKFTFHRATQLPFADVNTLSSDPYINAELITDLPPRHKGDPPMRHRTRTIRRNVNPEWNESWTVANVPVNGFKLKCRLYDEDPANHDDRLGNVHVVVPRLGEGFQAIREQAYKIKKASGSKRAYFIRGCAAVFSRDIPLSGDVVISVEVLGRTETDNGGRMWTIGPCNWIKHYSPMIGRLAGVKDTEQTDEHGNKIQRYNFQANQIQLRGPVPAEMYHRYVEFKPFVKGMFTGLGLRGKVLNRALHHQHSRIYNFARSTEYGSFEKPCIEMTKKFLDLVLHDEGGRIFTYILTLDGLWRFTETGKEFGIDLLSKHTMHSDVSQYIAFSGEFFIRRLRNPHRSVEETKTHPPDDIEGGPPEDSPPEDPAWYQLIIDNDSGTYRPNKDLLPTLKEFMQRSLVGLKVSTLDCQGDEEKMNKLKDEQRERKKAEGNQVVYRQADDASSISSSDESDLDEAVARENGEPIPGHKEKLRQRLDAQHQKVHPHHNEKAQEAATGSGNADSVAYEPQAQLPTDGASTNADNVTNYTSENPPASTGATGVTAEKTALAAEPKQAGSLAIESTS